MNIKKKDVDIENHTINLFDFKNQTSYKGFITNDLIPIFEQLLPQLKINDSLISTYAMDTIQHKMKAILDKLYNEGLEAMDSKNRAVTHTLRHTFASQLAMAGTPIFTIQKLMNHKDINMTLRYAKLAPDNGKIEVQGLYQ
jgi:integrase